MSDLNNDHYCSELESGREEHVVHTDDSPALSAQLGKSVVLFRDQDPSPSSPILSSIILFHGDIDFLDDIMYADGARVHLEHIGERRKRRTNCSCCHETTLGGGGTLV